jgi:alpha-beta hydrolase superfamily lysophospholipase
MAHWREGQVHTEDGLDLYWQSWHPAEPRALVVIVHGLAEHSGRYQTVARSFADAGLATYALDHRGHGKSPGLRVHVDSFDELRADVRAVLALARAEHPALPLFLLGHSQGGLVAATLALREPEGLAGLVLSSPLLGIAERSRPSPLRAAVGRVLASLFPRTLFRSDVDPTLLSRDPAVGVAYAADPLVSHAVSAGWYRALRQALTEAHDRAPSLRVPTLVLYAGADALVDPEATARWVALAPQALVQAFRYEGLYHEILNAPERARVERHIEAWIARQIGMASGEGPTARA